jgi:ABC-type polysaccharide/polyol phosphate export permease
MATATATTARTAVAATMARQRGVAHLTALATLARRRFALSARTPREVIVPLVNPVIFAVVLAPALAAVAGARHGGVDYMSFVAIGTVGLLVPISCLFAGIGVIVDRHSGAQRDLLAAPIARPLIVLGNLAVALTVSALQLTVLMLAVRARGAQFVVTVSGVAWFAAASLLLAVAMYGLAEILANRVKTQEEYVGIVPAAAILPYFFAGSLFPISVLPGGLTVLAKVLPLTHVLALLRYGLVDPRGSGLRDIWHMSNTTVMAALSLAVVAVFAAGLTALSMRVFARAAVR